MNVLMKFLYKYNVLEIDTKDIEKWIKNKNLNNLKYGIKEGVYDIRILCLEAYASFNTHDLKDILLFILNDEVAVVSKFAISILEEKFNDKKLQKTINRKKLYWKQYESKIQQENDSYYCSNNKQRSSPSDRLHIRFQEQKSMNNIPYGF